MEPARPLWSGSLEVGDFWAVWRGAAGEGEPHRHFAAQAVFSAEPVEVSGADGRTAQARCVLIDPLVPHKLSPAGDVEICYFEPTPNVCERLGGCVSRVLATPDRALFSNAAEQSFWTERLEGRKSAPERDERIRRLLQEFDDALFDERLTLRSAAESANLSVERFRRVFALQTGLTWRRYVLWRRLRSAAQALTTGADVTFAAHAAGFADTAHFARTLKSTFGVSASRSIRRDR